MRLLTVLAVAALAGGLYHFGSQRGRARQARLGRTDARLAEAVRSAIAGKGSGRVHMTDTDEPVGDLGPMQSGIATGP